jgi:hypothetical protein
MIKRESFCNAELHNKYIKEYKKPQQAEEKQSIADKTFSFEIFTLC